VQNKIESIQPTDPEVQKDFDEVWTNIEKSILKHEKRGKKQKRKINPLKIEQ
jgi:hypothetical protein